MTFARISSIACVLCGYQKVPTGIYPSMTNLEPGLVLSYLRVFSHEGVVMDLSNASGYHLLVGLVCRPSDRMADDASPPSA